MNELMDLLDTCERCRFSKMPQEFFDNTGKKFIYYDCHRKSPSISKNGDVQWPNVKAGDWCGQFESITPQRLDDRG